MSGKKFKTIAGHIKEVRPMEGHKLDGHEADIAELLKKGVTKGTIARIFGVSRPDLYYYMQKRQISFENKDKLTLREEEITEMFNSYVSLNEMAHFFQVSIPRMSQKIKEMGLIRSLSDVFSNCCKNRVPVKRYNQIKELINEGMNIGEVARTLKMSYSTVYSIISKLGLPVQKATPRKTNIELIDKRETIVKMHNVGINTKIIAAVFECDPQVIRYRLRSKGIKMSSNGRTITA